MAGTCTFCGEELKMFGKNGLVCGGITQPVCNACWEKYGDASQIERCRAVLKTGRAVEAERVRAFLEEREREQEEAQAETERMGKLMNCCGQPMTPLGLSFNWDGSPFGLAAGPTSCPVRWSWACSAASAAVRSSLWIPGL